MQNSFKRVKLLFNDGDTPVVLGYLPLNCTVVDAKDFLKKFKNGILIEKTHKFLQTQLILTGVGPCQVRVHSENSIYGHLKPCFSNNKDVPFSFLIPEKYIYLLPTDSNIPDREIRSWSIIEDKEIHKSGDNKSNENIYITYFDKEKLFIKYSSLIINIESINDKFKNLNEFIDKYKLFGGMTNGKLFILESNSVTSTKKHTDTINEILIPLGMNYDTDFVLTHDNSPYNEKGELTQYLHTPMPECVVAEWLGSQIDYHYNIVWHKEVKKINIIYPDYSIEKYQELLEKYFMATDPRKLSFNPTVIEIRKDEIVFGMSKHYGRLITDKNILLKYDD